MNQSLQQAWSILEPFKGELLAFVLTLVGSIIAFLLRPQVRLIWGRSNNSLHLVPTGKDQERVEIYAEKFFIQNTGRKPAINIEFVLSGKPDDLSVWQPRQYTELQNGGGHLVLTIPFVAPSELVVIDTVYINKRAATVESVKCQDALAKQVPFVTQRNFGPRIGMIVAILMLFGVAFILRLIGIGLFGG